MFWLRNYKGDLINLSLAVGIRVKSDSNADPDSYTHYEVIADTVDGEWLTIARHVSKDKGAQIVHEIETAMSNSGITLITHDTFKD